MHIDAFNTKLDQILMHAKQAGVSSVKINSGDLHREVGGYPGKGHRMPTCCQVMYRAMRSGDSIVSAPPKSKGASLTIEYRLPR